MPLIGALLACGGSHRPPDGGEAGPDAGPVDASYPSDGGSSQEPEYAPQPVRNGMTIGSDSAAVMDAGAPFTAAEYDLLATHYGNIHFPHESVLSRAVNAQAAAKELVRRNPSAMVFAYINSQIWFKANDWAPAVFNTDWLLKDNAGHLIPDEKGCVDRCNYYLDLANPAYRQWALDVAVSWMSAAPFAGVKFDHADFIGDSTDPTDRDTKLWVSALCPAGYTPTVGNMPATACPRVKAFNDGIVDLITRTHTTLGAMGKRVMFNGIAPSPKRVGRDEGHLAFSDGAMDEGFCLGSSGTPEVPLAEDFALLDRNPNKLYVLHSTYRDAANKKYGPYCFAAFLMIWQPGFTTWRFGISYGAQQLEYQLPDKDLNLGLPVGHFTQTGAVYSRTFERGVVFLNAGDAAAAIQLPSRVTQHADGKALQTYDAGATLTLAGHSAALFLNAPLH